MYVTGEDAITNKMSFKDLNMSESSKIVKANSHIVIELKLIIIHELSLHHIVTTNTSITLSELTPVSMSPSLFKTMWRPCTSPSNYIFSDSSLLSYMTDSSCYKALLGHGFNHHVITRFIQPHLNCKLGLTMHEKIVGGWPAFSHLSFILISSLVCAI